MNGQEAWEDLVDADGAYFVARTRLFQVGAEHQLELALASPKGRGAALRVLRDSTVELVMALIRPVFVAATSTHAEVGLARDVIARLDDEWLALALAPLVSEVLTSDSLDWSDYRRLAELLSDLGQAGLLAKVVDQAAASTDEDTREVANDFRAI